MDPETGDVESAFPNWDLYFREKEASESAATSAIKSEPAKFRGLNLKSFNLVKKNLRYIFNRFLGFKFIANRLVEGDWRTDDLAMVRDNISNEDYKMLIDVTENNIKRIFELLEKRGVKFYLVLAPMGYEVSPTEWHYGRLGWGAEQNKVYPTKVLDDLQLWSEENGIKALTLKPFLIDQGGPYFFPKDGHFTALGHQKVFEGIWSELDSLEF